MINLNGPGLILVFGNAFSLHSRRQRSQCTFIPRTSVVVDESATCGLRVVFSNLFSNCKIICIIGFSELSRTYSYCRLLPYCSCHNLVKPPPTLALETGPNKQNKFKIGYFVDSNVGTQLVELDVFFAPLQGQKDPICKCLSR